MGAESTQRSVWRLAREQHGVVTRAQLRELGFSEKAIRHRLAKGRLHRVWPDVYAVGRPELTQEGKWMAAVLTCGEGAVLSHASAAALWRIRDHRRGSIHVSVPSPRDPRRRGIQVHRRRLMPVAAKEGIPVTSPSQTIIDLAPTLTERQLERVIDEADKLDLVHPETLRRHAANEGGVGGSRVRTLLDTRTFLLTDSELERRFIPIAERAGLSKPETQARMNGYRVDFLFRLEGIVVETDGGRYHRTPSQQRRDRIRDHAHALAGLTPIRFTHDQIAHEPSYVAEVLRGLSSTS
jgi:very-short-patch-repair endonuclease